MLKAYANSPEMMKAYLDMNAIKKAHIRKEDGQFILFMTGEDETIGFEEYSASRQRDVIKYWDDCKVPNIVLDTITR